MTTRYAATAEEIEATILAIISSSKVPLGLGEIKSLVDNQLGQDVGSIGPRLSALRKRTSGKSVKMVGGGKWELVML